MTPAINLGVTQMCEHGLGASGQNIGSGWSGSFGANTRVALSNHSLTVKNPAGGYFYGRMTFSCYATLSAIIQGSTVVDSDAQTVWGEFAFSNATGGSAQHCHVAYSFVTKLMTAGAHTLSLGVWVAAGTMTFDSNDGGTAIVYEVP
jgi:hypothetical protein